jgi:phosphopantetheine--protein transferase-like protein
VLIAIARAQPLGVDAERIDRNIEVENLARRFYSREEADALAALPEPLRRAAFLRVWTCKEAVLKALGARLTPIEAPFDPEGGAYALRHTHDHHGHDHHRHADTVADEKQQRSPRTICDVPECELADHVRFAKPSSTTLPSRM